jgi:hypothetical protein
MGDPCGSSSAPGVTAAAPVMLLPGDKPLDTDDGRFPSVPPLPLEPHAVPTVPTGVLRNGSPGVSLPVIIVGVEGAPPAGISGVAAVGACGVPEPPLLLRRHSVSARDSVK